MMKLVQRLLDLFVGQGQVQWEVVTVNLGTAHGKLY